MGEPARGRGLNATSSPGPGGALRRCNHGRLIVELHRHLVAVIDGVIHDTYGVCYIRRGGDWCWLLLMPVFLSGYWEPRKGNEMSYRAIYVAAVAALGIACVSVDALTARVAADGVPQRHHRALLRHRLVGPIWYNPDYSTGSYSPSYSTGGYYHPGYSIKYHYPLYATSPCISAGTC